MGQGQRGFTLVEVLVAIGVMAVLALMSWRGIDGMLRTQSQLQQRGDQVRTLQAGLAQWQTDLNRVSTVQGTTAWDWDGKVLRLTREAPQTEQGLQVVAWTWRGGTATGGQWLRWQSPPLQTRGAWLLAWDNARVWSQTPTETLRAAEVAIHPLEGWQLFVHSGGNWTNPLSSDASSATPSASNNANPGGAASPVRLPDGVRLLLDLPVPSPLGGRLTLDWVRPTLTGAGA